MVPKYKGKVPYIREKGKLKTIFLLVSCYPEHIAGRD